MTPTKTHHYLGREICPVEYAEKARAGFRWYVRSTHPTGIPYDSQHCAHFFTLESAKESIRWSAHRADMEVNA